MSQARSGRLGMFAGLLAGMAGQAEEPAMKYMSPFSTAEYCAAHVRATSYAVPHDFVDGQWHGIIAASDGKTYFSVSSHSPDHSAQFYRFDPAKRKVEHLIDVAAWCGEAESVGQWNAQGKIHSQLFEADGKLYGATTPAHMALDHPYAGGHFLSYDLKTGAFADLGVFPDAKGGLLTMLHEPVKRRLYAISQGGQTLCYHDLATGQTVRIGPCQENPIQTRTLVSDARGNVYGCDWGRRIWRYQPATERIQLLDTRIPHDPDAPQPDPSKRDGQAWQSTQWKGMVWDPQTRWWYGVSGNDEYLFRFRPPEDEGLVAQVEGLAPFGFRPSATQPRYASLGLALRGRELFYCSYPLWQPMAHLMRYNLDTQAVTDLGPIVVEGGRRVAEIHSLVAGGDGKLHAVAMVWSREGSKDPAKPWGNRAQCFFHARFVTLDPDTDFEPGCRLGEAPQITPKIVEYAAGRSLSLYLPPNPIAAPAPALVLIHGGGWGMGSPDLLEPHARYFAGKGMVTVNVQYRLTRQEGVTLPDCVADVKAAVRWVRTHAAEYGIDPDRIVVSGESAGGHLAACTGLVPGFEPPDETVGSKANALILLNPVIDTASPDGWSLKGHPAEVQAQAQALSPAHHVTRGAPPTLVVHGDADAVTPLRWSERFAEAMREAGNAVTLVRISGAGHAFLIPGYGRHAAMDEALDAMEAFLVERGYLPAPSTTPRRLP